MSPATRETVEHLGFWFAPDKFPVSMGINIRNQIFGFFIGRVGYNIITDPAGTAEEFKDISWDELRNRMLSSNYLTTWLGRFIFQFFCVITGIAVLYSIGASENVLFARSYDNRSPLDDLNDSVQASLLQNFI